MSESSQNSSIFSVREIGEKPKRGGSIGTGATRLLRFWQRFRQYPQGIIGVCFIAALILMAIFAPFITHGVTPQSYFIFQVGFGNYGPSLADFPARIFGYTNSSDLQHSVFADVIYGARATLLVGFLSAFFSAVLGVGIGAIAGFWGGWFDTIVSRIIELALSLPFLPLAIALTLAAGVQATVPSLIIVFSSVGWADIARIIRANVIALTGTEYVEAAHSAGVGSFRIIWRHILPNTTAPIIIFTTLSVAKFITAEATLDFLLLGITNTTTWGNTLANAKDYMFEGNWWWVFFPGFFIVLTVLSINFIGEALRSTFNVRESVIGS